MGKDTTTVVFKYDGSINCDSNSTSPYWGIAPLQGDIYCNTRLPYILAPEYRPSKTKTTKNSEDQSSIMALHPVTLKLTVVFTEPWTVQCSTNGTSTYTGIMPGGPGQTLYCETGLPYMLAPRKPSSSKNGSHGRSSLISKLLLLMMAICGAFA